MIDELGGPSTFNHYAWGWTFAGNTPFRRWKRETYRGGISDPFVVHWPKGIKAKGEVRTQYAHAIDMVPTVLEALGIEAPTSIKGRHAVADRRPQLRARVQRRARRHRSTSPSTSRCSGTGPSITTAGARSVRGRARRSRKRALFFGAPIDKDKLTELDAKGWELYHVEKDFAENHNLAAENRPKLIEMIATWYVEAGKYNVLPIDSRGTLRFADPRPQLAAERKSYIYYPGTQMVPINAGPTS